MRIFWYALIGLIISTIMFNLLDNVYMINGGIVSFGIVFSTIICGCTGAIVNIIDSIVRKNNEETEIKEE